MITLGLFLSFMFWTLPVILDFHFFKLPWEDYQYLDIYDPEDEQTRVMSFHIPNVYALLENIALSLIMYHSRKIHKKFFLQGELYIMFMSYYVLTLVTFVIDMLLSFKQESCQQSFYVITPLIYAKGFLALYSTFYYPLSKAGFVEIPLIPRYLFVN